MTEEQKLAVIRKVNRKLSEQLLSGEITEEQYRVRQHIVVRLVRGQ